MKSKRVFAAFSLLLIIGVGFFLAYFQVTFTNPISRLEAEQKIYSALIGEDRVFEEYTTVGEIGISEEIIQYIKDQAPKIDNDTLVDFQHNNSQAHLLKDYLPNNNSYIFLSNAEVEQFYNDWQTFSIQQPNVEVINSFSRVGFNSRFTQAIVLENRNAKIFDAPFEYSGSGIIYIFKRIGGRWIMQDQLLVSITG